MLSLGSEDHNSRFQIRNSKIQKVNGCLLFSLETKRKRTVAVKKTSLFVLSAVLLSLLSGCSDDNVHFEEYYAIPDQDWYQRNQVTFEFDIPDTEQRYDLYFNLRHNKAFEWKNIWVFLTFEVPGGQMDRDTLEFVLQDGQGRWLGTSSGDLRDGSFLFKTNTRYS